MLTKKQWNDLENRLNAYDRRYFNYQNKVVRLEKEKQSLKKQADFISNNIKLFL